MKLQRKLAALAQAASVCFLWLLYQINWNMLSILLAAQLTAHARPLDAAPASVGLLQSRAAQPIMPVTEDVAFVNVGIPRPKSVSAP